MKRPSSAKPSRKVQVQGRHRAPIESTARESLKVLSNETPVSGRKIGYARISTDDQNLDLQRDALLLAGCTKIYEESGSSLLKSRPEFDKALRDCQAGDTLVCWSFDRIGRSVRNLLDIAADLQTRGVNLKSITQGIDTSTDYGIMVYTVLAAIAQLEKSITRERCRAGIVAKKKRGEPTGRRPTLNSSQIRAAQEMIAAGKTATTVARLFKCGRSTLYRALSERGTSVSA